jgi:hypothetical protein
MQRLEANMETTTDTTALISASKVNGSAVYPQEARMRKAFCGAHCAVNGTRRT